MRINRFYTEREKLRVGSSVKLPDFEVAHIRKVLRLKKGALVHLFNNEKEYIAKLDLVTNDVVMATIEKEIRSHETKAVELTLFLALLKAGKFDDILEKATELGVDKIVPIECEFSQSKIEHARQKIDRWNKILISASKQSHRIKIPDLVEPITFSDSLGYLSEFDLVYLFTTEEGAKKIDYVEGTKKLAYFIGPEGGFSKNEVDKMELAGVTKASLNTNILRSETAAIYSTGLLSYLYN